MASTAKPPGTRTAAKKKVVARKAAPAPARKRAAAPKAEAPPATAAKANGQAKPVKRKLVRDSFTIPRDEYGVIDELKLRAAKLGHISKKSELLRAGLKQLAALADAALLQALAAIPSVKTGRPKTKRHEGSAAGAPERQESRKRAS
ncbi:MAG TPA: hypothetical protein VF169_03315 [Albitalea sp.]|uniref:hypothetical protein n=1 Tax=Piscinibacter sp. TaxID=1903157 RepID=UPI002ED26C03